MCTALFEGFHFVYCVRVFATNLSSAFSVFQSLPNKVIISFAEAPGFSALTSARRAPQKHMYSFRGLLGPVSRKKRFWSRPVLCVLLLLLSMLFMLSVLTQLKSISD